MSLVDRLIHDLEADGLTVTAVGGDEYDITDHMADDDTATRFIVTERELEELLLDFREDGQDVFPEADPLQAAYQLFLVHVFEFLVSRPFSVIRVTSTGVKAFPDTPPPLNISVPPGVKVRWTHKRPKQ